MRPEPVALNLTPFVLELVRRLEVHLGVKPVVVHAPRDPLRIAADPHHLKRMMVCAIYSASASSDVGFPVEVTLEQVKGKVAISVAARGPELTREELLDLFEPPGCRPSAHRSLNRFRTGFRLCSRLAKAHRGRAWLKSEAGKGITIGFTMSALKAGSWSADSGVEAEPAVDGSPVL